ncbi:MAG: hypothetical protein PHH85_04865 [Candidatus Methanoperedens sp.]|nr:hypothetical protein [Candidatus Methanoperedens sp.]
MQDRYVADIGDFGKYGLLNFIASETKLRLGVNWYLTSPTPNENKSEDGKFYKYLLKDTKYAQKLGDCNKELYEKLQKIIREWDEGKNPEIRCLKQIEYHNILPKGTIFHKNELKENNRKNWLSRSISNLSGSELVFFDPDNGICIKDEDKSPKHVYCNEIRDYFENGQSLVVYQHADRTDKFNNVLLDKKDKLIKELEINNNQIICLRYKRGSARAFFIIMQQEHSVCITKAINDFLKTKWGEHEHFIKI